MALRMDTRPDDIVVDGNDLAKAGMFQGLPHEIVAWLDERPEHLNATKGLNTKVWRIFFGDYVTAQAYYDMYTN